MNSNKPLTENYKVQTEKIIKITEIPAYHIIISDSNEDHYYINSSLEHVINLDSLEAKVLNKTVTLHLPKVLANNFISEHIAQITIGNDIILQNLIKST